LATRHPHARDPLCPLELRVEHSPPDFRGTAPMSPPICRRRIAPSVSGSIGEQTIPASCRSYPGAPCTWWRG